MINDLFLYFKKLLLHKVNLDYVFDTFIFSKDYLTLLFIHAFACSLSIFFFIYIHIDERVL